MRTECWSRRKPRCGRGAVGGGGKLNHQKEIRVEHEGRTYNGHYIVDAGFIAVSSVYGSTGVRLKPSDNPADLAAKLLLEILKARRS